ncbi:MAG: hypothetical protein WED00_16930 [Aquisalimonadaceae bacterium]
MSDRAVASVALVIVGLLLSVPVAAQHDPTRPPAGFGSQEPVVERVPGTLPIVTAILRAANRRLALIDGEMVGVGDTVAGGSVVRIERDHVLLRINNETIKLGLAVGEIRRRPGTGER